MKEAFNMVSLAIIVISLLFGYLIQKISDKVRDKRIKRFSGE